MPQDPAPVITGEGITDQSATPTSVSGWKKQESSISGFAEKEGFIAELPSGNVVKMTRTLDMPLLLKTGQIPNPLAGIVQGMIDSRSPAFPANDMDNKVLEQLLDLLNETAVRAIIEPPFDAPAKRQKTESGDDYQARLAEWQPKKDHVSVWDLTMDDRFFVFAVAQGAAADLASFREEQERTMAGIQASEGVRKPTKRTGGSKPKKG